MLEVTFGDNPLAIFAFNFLWNLHFQIWTKTFVISFDVSE